MGAYGKFFEGGGPQSGERGGADQVGQDGMKLRGAPDWIQGLPGAVRRPSRTACIADGEPGSDLGEIAAAPWGWRGWGEARLRAPGDVAGA